MSPKHLSDRRGFSLIEVLLALAILGISLTALSQALVNAINAANELEVRDELYADFEFVARIALTTADREQFEDGGEIPLPNGNEARWEAQIEETQTLDLVKIELTIELPDSEIYPETEESFILYLHRTGWMDAFNRESLLTEKKEAREAERYSKRWP